PNLFLDAESARQSLQAGGRTSIGVGDVNVLTAWQPVKAGWFVHHEKQSIRKRFEHLLGRMQQLLVPPLRTQLCDCPHNSCIWVHPEALLRLHYSVLRNGNILLHRYRVEHHVDFARLDPSLLDQEVSDHGRRGYGASCVRRQRLVGKPQIPWVGKVHFGVIIVDDRGYPGHQAGHSPECRRPVTMKVHDVDLFFLDQPEQCAERRRIELVFIQDPDRHRAVCEDFFYGLRGSQKAGRYAEAIGAESRNDVPEEPASAVEGAVVTDVVNYQEYGDS